MFQVSILESPARPRPVGNLNAMPPGPCHHHPSTHNSTIKMNLESVKQSRIKSVFTSGSRPGPPRRRGPVELELKPPRAVGRTNFNLKTEPQPQTPPALERSGRAHCQLEGTASDSEVVARRLPTSAGRLAALSHRKTVHSLRPDVTEAPGPGPGRAGPKCVADSPARPANVPSDQSE